jgi:hypothetical protein
LTSTPLADTSESTDLVQQAGKPLALLSQSQAVKDVIHETIDRTLEAIVFVSGFPPVADRIRNGRLVVAAAAVKLGFKKIEARCTADIHYADEIAKVVRHIFSLCVLPLTTLSHISHRVRGGFAACEGS